MKKVILLCGLLALFLCCAVIPANAKDDKGKDAEGQESSDAWTKVHEGIAEAKPHWKNRKKVKVAFKEKKNEGLRIKITRIKYHKDPLPAGQTNPVTVGLSGDGPDQASRADLPSDIDWKQDVEIETTLYNGADDQTTPVGRVEYNFKWLDAGGEEVVALELGGDAVVAIDEEENPVTVFDIAQEQLSLDSSDFETPDLVLWCHDPINSGELRFCPVGEFRFTSLPDSENIYVFDEHGNDLSANVGVESMQLTARGDLSFALAVTGTTPPLGIIVRGVEVTLDENADENSKHGYTVGGSAVHHLQSEVCLIANGDTLLDNWQVMAWTPAYGWGYATAEIEGSEDPVVIGATTAVVSGNENSGYIESIVIEAASAGAIKNGKLILRGVSGVVFDPDENARLYLLNAATGEDLYDENIEASISSNSYGDLVVNFTNIETYCASVRVTLVLTAVQVSYSAPLSYGMAYDLVSFGPALRAPLRRATPFIEGLPEAGGLSDEPIEVTGWTAIGS